MVFTEYLCCLDSIHKSFNSPNAKTDEKREGERERECQWWTVVVPAVVVKSLSRARSVGVCVI